MIGGVGASLVLACSLAAWMGVAYNSNAELLQGYPPTLFEPAALLASYNITAPDPTINGPWSFQQYTFGPTKGRSYIKYDSQDPYSLRTDLLDLSHIIPPHPNGGFSAFHKWYWGYSEASLPVAGRAYMPTSGR